MEKKIALAIFQLAAMFLFGSILHAEEESKGAASQEMNSPQAESPSGDTYAEKLKRWQSLPEKERRIIRERARKLGPEKIRELREESVKLRSMPKDAQYRIRTNYQKFNRLPPREREALKERYRRFEKLPPERREEFRRRFRERRNALSGGPHEGEIRIPKSERSADFKKNTRTPRKEIWKRPEYRGGPGLGPDRQGGRGQKARGPARRPEYRKSDSQHNKGMPRVGIKGPRGGGRRK